MKVCFGIISIGQKYLEEFEKLFKPSVSAYCSKYGYDLKIFTDYIDSTRNQPDTISFQKCLVPDQLRNYDLVVILDADIYVEKNAPPIHELSLNDKIGIVDEVAQSTPENYRNLILRFGFEHGTKYYSMAGFQIETSKILNTGVILCNPTKHADYLKSIYEKYVDQSIGHPRKFHYEQSCIGYELQKDNNFTVISNFWNFIYFHATMTRQPIKCYFLHLAGIGSSSREVILSTHTRKSLLTWRK